MKGAPPTGSGCCFDSVCVDVVFVVRALFVVRMPRFTNDLLSLIFGDFPAVLSFVSLRFLLIDSPVHCARLSCPNFCSSASGCELRVKYCSAGFLRRADVEDDRPSDADVTRLSRVDLVSDALRANLDVFAEIETSIGSAKDNDIRRQFSRNYEPC